MEEKYYFEYNAESGLYHVYAPTGEELAWVNNENEADRLVKHLNRN